MSRKRSEGDRQRAMRRCPVHVHVCDVVDRDGRHIDGFGHRTDQVGGALPAVPVGNTYYGYTSVPDAGCDWWRALPTYGSQP